MTFAGKLGEVREALKALAEKTPYGSWDSIYWAKSAAKDALAALLDLEEVEALGAQKTEWQDLANRVMKERDELTAALLTAKGLCESLLRSPRDCNYWPVAKEILAALKCVEEGS